MTADALPEPVNVLIVEDDEIDAEVVKRAFRKNNLNHRIYHARCGADALAMLRGEQRQEKVPQPCIMLVDVNMPQMNGIEFLHKLRHDQNLAQCTAFMLSTSRRDADISEAYRLGVAGYFLKETVEDLVPMLAMYLHINLFMR